MLFIASLGRLLLHSIGEMEGLSGVGVYWLYTAYQLVLCVSVIVIVQKTVFFRQFQNQAVCVLNICMNSMFADVRVFVRARSDHAHTHSAARWPRPPLAGF